jgi:hypothetical protein
MLTFSAKPRRRHTTSHTTTGPGLAPLTSQSVAAPQRADEPVDPLAAADEQDSVPNRGWHDSSMELKRGLEVLEDVPLDALPDDMRRRLGAPRWR